MTKSEIRIFAHKQTLGTGKATAKYAGDTVNYIKVHFNLDENWDGYDSIRAVWANKATISTLLDSNNDCVIPFEVLANKGDVIVNLIASKVENGEVTDRFTSYPFVACSITADVVLNGSETAPITPSQFEQFVEAVKEDADRAEASADDAEQSASASASSASQASEHAQEAEISAERAETAKDDAETARDEILGMRATANTLPSGSDATASYADGLLTLGIPRGDTGEKGEKGEKGDTGEKGEKGEKGDTGEVSLAMLNAMFASALPTDTASGSIASFPDGTDILPAISVLDSIEPIQDLHGYDKPWSGGNGKNKIYIIDNNSASKQRITITGTEGNLTMTSTGAFGRAGYTASVIIGETYTFSVDITKTESSGANSALYLDKSLSWDGSYAARLIANVSTEQHFSVTFTATTDLLLVGFYVSRSDSNYGDTLVVKNARLEVGTTATAYEPYSNICPISGRTECVTEVSGVNVWDEEWELGYYNNTNGGKANSNTCIRCKNKISVQPNTTYFFHSPNRYSLRFYDAQDGYLGRGDYASYAKDTEFTTPNGCYYVCFYMEDAYGTTYNNDISINYPSTDHDYHAYNGTTYTTDLGRTVYGGTLDVVSGLLTVDRVAVDMGSLSWGYDANRGQFRVTVADKANAVRNVTNYICSAYASNAPVSGYADATDGLQACYASSALKVFILIDANYTDVNTFKTAVSGQTICYELSTPQTIQLTPQEVALLKGQNNLWADSGDVTVVYKADIQKYIEKKMG